MKKKIILMILGMSLCFSACGQVQIGSLTLGSSAEKEEEPEIISEEISVNVSQTQKENEEAAAQQEKEMRENSMVPSGSQNPSVPVFTDPVIEEEKEYTKEQLSDLIPKNMQQDIDFAHGHATQTVFGQDGEIHIKTDTGKTTLDMYMKCSDIVYKLMLGDNEYAGKTSIDDWQGKVSVNSGYVHEEDTITYLGTSENQTGIFDVVQAEGSGTIRYYFDKDQNLVYMETTDMSTGKPTIISISKAKDDISFPDWANTVETDENEQGFGTAFMIAMFAASCGDEDADYSSYEGKTLEEIAQEFAAKSFGQMMLQDE